MKRFLAGSLAALMLASAPLAVSAERYGTITRSTDAAASDTVSEENRLKQILYAVKSVIDIPEEYTEFEYDIYTRYDEETWSLNWAVEDYGKSISVEADQYGNITRYNEFIRNNKTKAPTVYRKEAMETAYNFVEKLYPEIMDELELYNDDVSSNTYRFYFRRVVNGLPYDRNTVNVIVDYTTGRVKQFRIDWEHDAEFDTTDDIITLDDAVAKWKEDFKLDLKYCIFADYDNDGKFMQATAKLVYMNSGTQTDILAKSGEYLEKSYGWTTNDKDMEITENAVFGEAASDNLSAGSSVKFNESELERMAELEGYITIDEADKAVRTYKQLALDDSFTLSSYSKGTKYMPYSDNENRPVIWNLRYTGKVTEGSFETITARASVNAETGELLSFSTYKKYSYFDENGNFVKPTLKLDSDSAQALADEFLKTVNPERYKSLEFSDSTPEYSIDYISSEYGKTDSENDGWYYTTASVAYNRIQNGFEVNGNGASVTVDCVDGKITRYSVEWTDELTFDAEKQSVDFDAARDAYIENSDKQLEYIRYTVYLYDEAADSDNAEKDLYYGEYSDIRTRNETRLVYTFNIPFYAVSAVDGKPLEYSAKYFNKPTDEPFGGYNDIENHWAQDKIELLSDIDVLLPAESFNPDEAVTQKEFALMLMSASNFYTEIDTYAELDSRVGELISYMNNNSLTDEDIEPDAPLMRKDAAKFIMRAMGYEKIANIGDIFKTDFLDNDSIDPAYIGYVAIAKALGIINGSDGFFNGDESITKAESVVLIYNYMNADK